MFIKILFTVIVIYSIGYGINQVSGKWIQKKDID